MLEAIPMYAPELVAVGSLLVSLLAYRVAKSELNDMIEGNPGNAWVQRFEADMARQRASAPAMQGKGND